MATTTTKPGNAFIQELEQIRTDFRKEAPRGGMTSRSREEGAQSKRSGLRGAAFNHTFAGEQYVNCPVKDIRRKQLQKLMDEGGQVYFSGPVVSHPTLAHWEAKAYGLTDEEIYKLEREDYLPDELILRGWRVSVCRNAHFSVAIGTSYVGEGETLIRSQTEPEKVAQELDELREQFKSWGVEDLEKAMANRAVHAEADEDHGTFNQWVIREFCDTPELQEEMRQVFILRAHSRLGRHF